MHCKLLSVDNSLHNKHHLDMHDLNQLNYTLSLLNSYFKHPSLNQHEFIANIVNVNSSNKNLLLCQNDWFYFINTLLLIDLYGEKNLNLAEQTTAGVKSYELTRKLVQGLVSEFNKLLFFNKFLHKLLSFLNANEQNSCEFKHAIVFSNSRIELNNVSFFLQSLLEKLMSATSTELVSMLNQFALSLIKDINDETLIFYLYEIPFAKNSILDNVSKLSENIDHYYGIFAKLIEATINTKLAVLIDQLKSVGYQAQPEILNALLTGFNTTINVLTKYVTIYFDMFRRSSLESIADQKLYNLFNLNEKTNDFVQNVLSRHLIKILELIMELKVAIQSPSGYFFYFNFDKEALGDNCELRWSQLSFLDKLNNFMNLFFTQINKRGESVSLYLNEKHLDFILCYSCSIVQGLNRALTKSNDKYHQIFSINFFKFLHSLVITVKYHVGSDSLKYPKSIFSDWCGFFSKEIFDPLLLIYVRLATANDSMQKSFPYLANLTLSYEIIQVFDQLANLISEITFDRLLLNQLEPKFNVLDLNLKPSNFGVNLPESLKTVLNYLIPNLKHQIKSVQLSSYALLRVVMKEANKYFENSSKSSETRSNTEETTVSATSNTNDSSDLSGFDENSDEKKQNLIESLPHVFRESLFELIELFSDIKNAIPFEESLLVTPWPESDDLIERLVENQSSFFTVELDQLRYETNNKVMSYLLLNKLVLDMFSNENLEFKVKLVNELREINFIDHLCHCLFRLMPSFKFTLPQIFEENYETVFDSSSNSMSFTNEVVRKFACKMYKHSLKAAPAMIRDWWNIQPKRIADQVDKYTAKYVSPVLLEEEIRQINRSSSESSTTQILSGIQSINLSSLSDDSESSIKIKGMLSTREVVSMYSMKDLNMELVIKLPVNYPLGIVQVSSIKRLGVSENQWRNWLLQLTTFLTHQNGSIIQGLNIWKRNVDKKFNGVEECTICYSVIHGITYQLPRVFLNLLIK